jgi:hypothetical protein
MNEENVQVSEKRNFTCGSRGAMTTAFENIYLPNPFVDDTDGKWYWRDQTFDVHGPFETENAAKDDLNDFVLNRFRYEDRF